MAVIYMQHPDHGSKVAIMEQEAEADEQNRWVPGTILTRLLAIQMT
jgi:hypothetical protein